MPGKVFGKVIKRYQTLNKRQKALPPPVLDCTSTTILFAPPTTPPPNPFNFNVTIRALVVINGMTTTTKTMARVYSALPARRTHHTLLYLHYMYIPSTARIYDNIHFPYVYNVIPYQYSVIRGYYHCRHTHKPLGGGGVDRSENE